MKLLLLVSSDASLFADVAQATDLPVRQVPTWQDAVAAGPGPTHVLIPLPVIIQHGVHILDSLEAVHTHATVVVMLPPGKESWSDVLNVALAYGMGTPELAPNLIALLERS